jgi:hypothetical protein
LDIDEVSSPLPFLNPMKAFLTVAVGIGFFVFAYGQQVAVTNPKEITVVAYIDGPSTLHLSLKGLYWTNGVNAKPGRHEAENYPTYIDTKPWMPKWGKDGDDRGSDTSDVYPLALSSVDYELEVAGISDKKNSSKVDRRTMPSSERKDREFLVHIPDPEVGAKWYKLRLRLRKP